MRKDPYKKQQEADLGGDFSRFCFWLDRLLEVLNILLHTFALVLVLQPEGLILHDLLLLRQVGLWLLLRRHSFFAFNLTFKSPNKKNLKEEFIIQNLLILG